MLFKTVDLNTEDLKSEDSKSGFMSWEPDILKFDAIYSEEESELLEHAKFSW